MVNRVEIVEEGEMGEPELLERWGNAKIFTHFSRMSLSHAIMSLVRRNITKEK